jgi:hypothetical protein
VAAFDHDDIDLGGLQNRHRVAMLDCILAWAKFETMFRAMLSAVELRSLDEGAALYNRLQLSMGWSKLHKALRDRGAVPSVLAQVKKLEAGFRKHVRPRQYIAHASCIGTSHSDPDYIAFSAFESDRLGELVLLFTPIEEIERSTAWATGASGMANNILKRAGL